MGTAGELEGQQQRATLRIPRCKWSTHLPVDGTAVRGKETEEGRMVACLFCFFYFLFFFDISCYCCLFCRVVYVVGEGAGFVKRGVVVGGGFSCRTHEAERVRWVYEGS